MSVSLSLYIVLHFFVDLLCQINLPLEKKKKKKECGLMTRKKKKKKFSDSSHALFE